MFIDDVCCGSQCEFYWHHNDVIISAMAYEITSLTIVYSNVYSVTDQRKHQSSASLAFVRGIHRWPVKSPHKGPVTRKMFPFDDVIIITPKRLFNNCYATLYFTTCYIHVPQYNDICGDTILKFLASINITFSLDFISEKYSGFGNSHTNPREQ